MTQNGKQLKCQRCESDAPALLYNPNTPNNPQKRVALCDKCAVKDPKVILLEQPFPDTYQPAFTAVAYPSPGAESKAEPVAEETNEIETIEFGPVTPEPIEENIVTGKSVKRPKASQNLAKDAETKPIDRADVEKKIERQEKDLDTLLKKRQELQGQLDQVVMLIGIKKGAVAALRDLLGGTA